MLQTITGLQERKQVQLADGTTIWLEPGSSLHYPTQFNDSTSFTVKAYAPASQEVTVVTGRVMVQADDKTKTNTQPLTVTPNQQACWNNRSQQLEKKELPALLIMRKDATENSFTREK